MLKRGGAVNVGNHDDMSDDTPVVLTRGEVVLNKRAADEFGPILERMNDWGRSRMGGMSVGPTQADGGSSARRSGHAGGFGITGRPRDERR